MILFSSFGVFVRIQYFHMMFIVNYRWEFVKNIFLKKCLDTVWHILEKMNFTKALQLRRREDLRKFLKTVCRILLSIYLSYLRMLIILYC